MIIPLDIQLQSSLSNSNLPQSISQLVVKCIYIHCIFLLDSIFNRSHYCHAKEGKSCEMSIIFPYYLILFLNLGSLTELTIQQSSSSQASLIKTVNKFQLLNLVGHGGEWLRFLIAPPPTLKLIIFSHQPTL